MPLVRSHVLNAATIRSSSYREVGYQGDAANSPRASAVYELSTCVAHYMAHIDRKTST